MTSLLSGRVIAVTVTYGERKELLTQVIAAAQSEKVSCMVVVDNGTGWSLRDDLSAKFNDYVDIVEMGRNTGSAGGYAAGIKRALDLGADYVWLLDDDNRPAAGCLDELLAVHEQLLSTHERDHLAVLPLRTAHRANRNAQAPSQQIYARRNAFLGFHFVEIPQNIWRRTPWGRPREHGELPALINVPVAPYGGLLLHRSALEAIGLPREDFMLYADDHEFTYRITGKGGRIVKVTGALVEDLEGSWDVSSDSNSSFEILLKRGGDTQAYYGVRNRVYFEARFLVSDRMVYYSNLGMHLAILGMLSLFLGKTNRYRLVIRAVRDGIAGRLGLHPKYLL